VRSSVAGGGSVVRTMGRSVTAIAPATA
jgi:hypothetical protein